MSSRILPASSQGVLPQQYETLYQAKKSHNVSVLVHPPPPQFQPSPAYYQAMRPPQITQMAYHTGPSRSQRPGQESSQSNNIPFYPSTHLADQHSSNQPSQFHARDAPTSVGYDANPDSRERLHEATERAGHTGRQNGQSFHMSRCNSWHFSPPSEHQFIPGEGTWTLEGAGSPADWEKFLPRVSQASPVAPPPSSGAETSTYALDRSQPARGGE